MFKPVISLCIVFLIIVGLVLVYGLFILSQLEFMKVILVDVKLRGKNIAEGAIDFYDLKILMILNNTSPYTIEINYTLPTIYVYNIKHEISSEVGEKTVFSRDLNPFGKHASIFTYGSNNYKVLEIITSYVRKHELIVPINYTIFMKYNCSIKLLGFNIITVQRILSYDTTYLLNISEIYPWDIEAYWHPPSISFNNETHLYVLLTGPLNGTLEIVIFR